MAKQRIGDRIRQLRTDRKMKQRDLAEKLGLSPSTVGMYEQNRRIPEMETILRLSLIFDVSTDYLLGSEKSENILPQPVTSNQKTVLQLAKQLSDDDIQKLIDYAELLINSAQRK